MTIKEMALKAYPSMPDPRSDSDDVWDYNEQYRDCYIEGANAVLKEIEAVLNKGNESRCDDFFTIAEIERKIKQLKEE